MSATNDSDILTNDSDVWYFLCDGDPQFGWPHNRDFVPDFPLIRPCQAGIVTRLPDLIQQYTPVDFMIWAGDLNEHRLS